MSIVQLKKITLFAQQTAKSQVIRDLQKLSVMHLTPLKAKQLAPEIKFPSDIANIKNALTILNETSRKRPVVKKRTIDTQAVIAEVIQVKHDIEQINEDILELKEAIDKLRPWGDFSPPNKDELKGYQLWFYQVPLDKLSKIPQSYVYEIVAKDHKFAYLVLIAVAEAKIAAKFVGMKCELGAESLTALEERLENFKIKLEDLADKRRALTQYRYLLAIRISEFKESTDRAYAHDNVIDHKEFFVLEGWVPTAEVDKIEKFCATEQIGLLVEDPQPNDKVPTLLKNNKVVDAGELLIDFYQSPGYTTLDPSAIIYCSFATFFAMIISDAGYGLALSLIFLYKLAKIKRSKHGRQLVNLFALICFMTIIYGVFAGSYFGFAPKANTIWASLKLIQPDNFNFMMKFSVGIGILHILLANLMLACKTKLVDQRANAIGFMLLILTGVAYYFSNSIAISSGFFALAVLVFLGFGAYPRQTGTKATSIKSAIIRGLKGAIGLTAISSLFGDIMSYMRLFALGMAGASLSLTFNKMAKDVFTANPTVGVLLAAIILFLGHGLNLLISIISGVVHGLRLNYIEFFKWSLPEDGFKFKVFGKRSQQVVDEDF